MTEAQFLEASAELFGEEDTFMAGRLFKSAPSQSHKSINEYIGPLFRVFDNDGSGTMDFEEFMLASNCTSLTDPGAKLRCGIILNIFFIMALW